MATKQGAKASRMSRAKVALSGGLTADELFEYLAGQYLWARGNKRLKIGGADD